MPSPLERLDLLFRPKKPTALLVTDDKNRYMVVEERDEAVDPPFKATDVISAAAQAAGTKGAVLIINDPPFFAAESGKFAALNTEYGEEEKEGIKPLTEGFDPTKVFKNFFNKEDKPKWAPQKGVEDMSYDQNKFKI